MITSQNKLWKFMCGFSKWNVLQLKRNSRVGLLTQLIDSNVDLFNTYTWKEFSGSVHE